jgi:hypothetical protein
MDSLFLQQKFWIFLLANVSIAYGCFKFTVLGCNLLTWPCDLIIFFYFSILSLMVWFLQCFFFLTEFIESVQRNHFFQYFFFKWPKASMVKDLYIFSGRTKVYFDYIEPWKSFDNKIISLSLL